MNYDKKPLLEKEEQDEFKVIPVSVKLTPKQIQKLEKVKTILQNTPQNKLEDIAEIISAKKIKTENLFETLTKAKNDIADKFSNHYFEDSTDYYWLGEVLSINDEFIDLENIEFAITYDLKEKVLFKYLSKPRNYNLSDYCLGKVGRKNKKKQELKKCKENVNYAWGQLQEAIAQETNKTDIFKERNIYNNLEDKE